jgi:hypothetical protein
MAKRERFEMALKCECGKTGTARWEEDENPVYSGGRLNLILVSVSEGFRIERGAEIVCLECNRPVKNPN